MKDANNRNPSDENCENSSSEELESGAVEVDAKVEVVIEETDAKTSKEENISLPDMIECEIVEASQTKSQKTKVDDKNAMNKEDEMQLDHLKIGLDLARTEHANSIARLRSLDLKINVLFVFIAGLLASLGFIVNLMSQCEEWQKVACIVFLAHFTLFIVLAIVIAVISFFPKPYEELDVNILKDKSIYKETYEDFYINNIKAYVKYQGTISTVCEKKAKLFKFACFALLSSLAYLLITMIILII